MSDIIKLGLLSESSPMTNSICDQFKPLLELITDDSFSDLAIFLFIDGSQAQINKFYSHYALLEVRCP